MVVVPDVTPEVPPLRKNPAFLYYEDNFQRPNPFRPDIAVSLDDSIDKKVDALDSHVSQFYEWLPWVDGKLEEVPKDPAARKIWLKKTRLTRDINPAVRSSLVKWYGPDKGRALEMLPAKGSTLRRVRRRHRRNPTAAALLGCLALIPAHVKSSQSSQ